MKIQIETTCYNEHRYGKPYIAKCDNNGKVTEWGEWIGQRGDAGMLEIDAEPGTIIMHGQKDHRGKNSAPSYRIAGDDDDMTKVDAVKRARALADEQVDNPLTVFSDDQLLAEIKRRNLVC
jgi:hypothetical protein